MSSPGYKKGIWPGQIEGRTHRDTKGPQRDPIILRKEFAFTHSLSLAVERRYSQCVITFVCTCWQYSWTSKSATTQSLKDFSTVSFFRVIPGRRPGYILWSSTYLLFGYLWYQVGHLCSLHAKGSYGYKSCRRRRHPTKGDLCVFAQNDSRNGMNLSAHVIPTSQDPTRGTRAGKNIHHMLAIKNRTHLFKGISDRKQNSILETYAWVFKTLLILSIFFREHCIL